MRMTAVRLIGTLAASAIVLSACGTTEDARNNDSDDPAEGSEENANAEDTGDASEATGAAEEADSEADSGPITVTDSQGNEITLEDGPATRVVTLEWAQTEAVVSLGVDPVGVADPNGYQSWVGEVVPLRDDPVDVGIRREPSTDAIVGLEPDLILGVVGSIPDSELEHLERAAPVVLFEGADAEDPIGHVIEDFETIGTLLGKDAEAEELINDFDAQLEENAAAIEDAGLAGRPLVMASPYLNGSTLEIRMHGPRTAPQEVAHRIGFDAAWTDPGDDEYGLSTTDIEGLTTMPDDAIFLYWGNDDEEEDLVETAFGVNPVWRGLPYVEAGDVHRAGVGIWLYGGPASLAAWSDDIVDLTTN